MLQLVHLYNYIDKIPSATACAIGKATELPALLKTKDPTYDAVSLTIWVK